MAPARDPQTVSRGDEEKLRRFVHCRDTGDLEGAQRWWTELVEDNADRVRGMVAVWGRDGRLSAEEQEEAVQTALIKVWRNMVGTFAGTSMGEWVNAVKRCTEFACLDIQRRAATRRTREGSLDETIQGEEGAVGRYDRRLAEHAEEEHRRHEERAEASGFVTWAVAQMKNERRRIVIERTLDGVPAEEIAAELEVEIGNLYQLRKRGMDDLARLKERYDP